MKTYFLVFLVSLLATVILTPVVGRVCKRLGWLDQSGDPRRVHQTPVPRLGGVAIFAAILIGLGTLAFVNNFDSNTLLTDSSKLLTVLAPATLIFLIGVYDDFCGANAQIKFAAQIVAGLLFCMLGGRIEALSVPLVGSMELHALSGYALTLLWTVGISNAFNLIDGIDGLATGASLFAALVILVVSLMLGHPLVTIMSVVMCGALIGFLPYNFNPASIFLGDSGSLFIGFTLAALSVLGTQKASTAVAVAIPLIAFGVPVVDTSFSVARRFVGNKPLFKGDREHVHHMLLALGWSQRRVALVLYAACALFGLSALLLLNNASTRATGFILFVLAAAIIVAVGRLRYHEVDEVKAGMRRRFLERRLRVARNISVRRASREMADATSLNEVFNATEALLELGEFVYATMRLSSNQEQAQEEGLCADEQEMVSEGCHVRNGIFYWSWQRGNIEPADVVSSGHFWRVSLPLTTANGRWGYLDAYRAYGVNTPLFDINYLCELFQPETAKAVERVLLDTNELEKAHAQPTISFGKDSLPLSLGGCAGLSARSRP